MKVVASMRPDVCLRDVAAHARRVESLGYDALSVPEAKHEGTLAAFAALAATSRLRVNTGVLVAFCSQSDARRPGCLGSPGLLRRTFRPRRRIPDQGQRDRVASECPGVHPPRACATTSAPYGPASTPSKTAHPSTSRASPTLSTGCNPSSIPDPWNAALPPILMGAVGPIMTRTVGEMGDMLQTHPTSSEARFLREVTRPRLEEGRKRSALEEPVQLLAGPLVATGRDQAAVDAALKSARETLVFTLSTPAYWPRARVSRLVGRSVAAFATSPEREPGTRWTPPSPMRSSTLWWCRATYDVIAERIVRAVRRPRRRRSLSRSA